MPSIPHLCSVGLLFATYCSVLIQWEILSFLIMSCCRSSSLIIVLSLSQSDVVAGFPLESILTAVLEALSSPSLSFIGVSYDSSISLQAGQCMLHMNGSRVHSCVDCFWSHHCNIITFTALVNVEDSDRFPVLTSFMHGKVLVSNEHILPASLNHLSWSPGGTWSWGITQLHSSGFQDTGTGVCSSTQGSSWRTSGITCSLCCITITPSLAPQPSSPVVEKAAIPPLYSMEWGLSRALVNMGHLVK